MFCIGICDDDEGLCGELEKMLYDYGKEHKIQMNIEIFTQVCDCFLLHCYSLSLFAKTI